MLMKFALLLLVCLLTVSAQTSADTVDSIRSRGSLRVGMSGDYQPFSRCEDSSSECRGLDVDIAQRLARDLGVTLEIVRFQWPDLLEDLSANAFDVAMSGVTIRPERALIASFTRPYLIAGAVVMVAETERFPSLAAVNQPGVRLVVNAGGHLEKVARSRFPALSLITTPNNLSLPDFIQDKRADALLTDSLEAPHFLAEHPQLRALPPIGRDRKAYMLSRSNDELRNWLDAWLQERETDGFLPDVRRRWLGDEAVQQPFPPLAGLLALIDLRLALMPAVAAYKQAHDLPIEDLQQEAIVLEKIGQQAKRSGLAPSAVQDLFRLQIDMAKQIQRHVLTSQQPLPAWTQGRDLKRELRPVLSQLSDRIIQELLYLRQTPGDRDELLSAVEQDITIEGVTPQTKHKLGQVLWRIRQAQAKELER